MNNSFLLFVKHFTVGDAIGYAIVKWVTKTSPCAMLTPSNTAVPWLTPRTIPNCSSDDSCTLAQVCYRVPTGYNGSPPKLPLLVDRSSSTTTFLIPGPIRPTTETASIFDQPFCHNALDRQTNRWLAGMFVDYSPPLTLYKERHGLIIIRPPCYA